MQTRSQTIAETLRNLILEGEYLPGERLEEVPLAVRMEVSRTPVRAALATLENIARLHDLELRRRGDGLVLQRHETVGKAP